MTARTSGLREPRRAPELRLPYPLLEYLLRLPGDYAKLVLRLLQRAQWTPVVTQTGVALDAGEVLLSLRSRDVWDAVELDREVDEAGRVSLLRRVLGRIERDGVAATRAARDLDTPDGTRTGTRRDTPATVVRFLKFRDSLWPARTDATHAAAHGAARGAKHQSDAIPSREAPATPASQRAQRLRPDGPPLNTLADLAQYRDRLEPRRPRAHAEGSTWPPPSPVDAPSPCPEWTALARNLQQRLRPDLFEHWFAGLTGAVQGDELVLHATDDFHRAFLEDNYRGFLAEELGRALSVAGSPPRPLGLRITSSPRSCAGGAAP